MTSPFRLTLLKVCDVLTEKNVKDLAFLCEDISPARAQLINNARELFAALQAHGLLNERKVNVLIDWLDELRLLEASNLLKDYRRVHLKGCVKSQENCSIHDDLPLKYFCVSCDSKICPDCAFTTHNQTSCCDVIPLDKASEEVCQRRGKLMKELEGLESGIASAEQLWKEKKDFLSGCRELTRTEHTDKSDEKESAAMKLILEERKETQILENEVKILRKYHKLPPETALTEILMIKKSTKKIEELKLQLEKQKNMLKTSNVGGILRNGVFCIITVSILIGSVALGNDQLLHLFDERQSNKRVLLVCIDPKDPSKEYWRRQVKIDTHHDPVVMSNLGMYYSEVHHALFAVGKKVFIVHPHWKGSLYVSVQSISSLEIDEVDEGSWITNISAHRNNTDVFIISSNCDHSVREYNVYGSVLRIIDPRHVVLANDIFRVAYNVNTFAIIGRGLNDVILIDTIGTVKQCGTLRLPSYLSGRLPINMIWTKVDWLVLYVSDGVEKVWMVVNYAKTGEFIKVCEEGTSYNEMDVPVSIARSYYTGYVTLANATVRSFKY